MSTIFFEAVVVDDVIRIPKQFRKSIGEGKVQVSVRDDDTPVSKNCQAWQRFLTGLEGCTDDESLEFERVNFKREVLL